jgi:hypothetical protein
MDDPLNPHNLPPNSTSPKAGLVDVRDDRGKLLFQFDPLRDVVKIVSRSRGVDAEVWLGEYRSVSLVNAS